MVRVAGYMFVESGSQIGGVESESADGVGTDGDTSTNFPESFLAVVNVCGDTATDEPDGENDTTDASADYGDSFGFARRPFYLGCRCGLGGRRDGVAESQLRT